VKIEVFNIMGQKVATLLDRQELAGVHNVAWAGVDDAGKPVASGVYFYRLVSDNFTDERKMVLLK
jgi:flagellar hook assembly protein FlgD